MEQLIDGHNRKIDYLRLSVTDRCNLRCVYCMPERGIKLLSRRELLTFEEILKVVRILSELGINKVRLTGGEPLLRDDILKLIGYLKNVPGIEELAITTNGILLDKFLKKLCRAGIRRINISLDSLDPKKYREITRGGDSAKVLNAIETSIGMGLENIKINTVLTGFFDRKDSMDFIKFAMEKPVSVRFIEMMPVLGLDTVECGSSRYGTAGRSKMNVENILKIMGEFGKVSKLKEPMGYGPAFYYKIEGSRGQIGFIMNKKESCYHCNRIRLTSKGTIKSCLFSDTELNVKKELRNGSGSEKIKDMIKRFVKEKPENRDSNQNFREGKGLKILSPMSKIGG